MLLEKDIADCRAYLAQADNEDGCSLLDFRKLNAHKVKLSKVNRMLPIFPLHESVAVIAAVSRITMP